MGKFRKLSVVLLLAFVLLVCLAPSVFAVNEFTFEVVVKDKDQTSPYAYDGSDPLYAYVEVIHDGEVYWAAQQINNPQGQNTLEVKISNFYATDNDDIQRGWGATSYTYDSSTCTFKSARLFAEAPNYYDYRNKNSTHTPRDSFSGYDVLGRTDSPDKTTVTIAKAFDKTFTVRLDYEPEFSTSIAQSDRYYILITVDHETTDNSYHLIPLETNGSDPQDFVITEWKDGNGNPLQNEHFTGHEEGVTVELLEANQELNYNNAIAKTNCVVISQSSLVKDYRVDYDSSWGSGIPTPYHNETTGIDEYVYTITLTKVNASDDYTFRSILGPGIFYGITAEKFDQGNHIQSNFATNLYDGHNKIVEADLASSMGSIVMSDAVEYNGHYIDIGESHNGGNLLIYTDKPESGLLINPRDFVTVITADHDDLKNNYVDPIINYGTTISNQLITHTATITPDIGEGKILIDTTAFPDNATIYIEADGLASGGKLVNGNLEIRKDPDQLLVFNFDTTETLALGEFYVQYPDMSAFSEVVAPTGNNGRWIKSDTPTTQGEKNNALDEISRHIVWNCNSVTDLTLGMTAGMFLVPDKESYTNTAQTSSGWIITGGTFHNSGGEWHFNYQELEDIDETNLTAKKSVNSAIPSAKEKFTFKIERFTPHTENDPVTYTWETIATPDNEGAMLNFKLKEPNLAPGWNAFRITETAVSSDNTSGNNYAISTSVYYAAVKYQVISKTEGTIKVAMIPDYYQIFDEEPFKANAATSISAGDAGFTGKVKEAAFNNALIDENGFSLGGEKTLDGQTPTVNDYEFHLYQFDSDDTENPWHQIKTAQNNGRSFSFETIPFSSVSAGQTYWYRIAEYEHNMPDGITADNTVYIVKVVINEAGDAEIHTYYKLMGEESALIQNQTINEQVLTQAEKAEFANTTARGSFTLSAGKSVTNVPGTAAESRTFGFKMNYSTNPASDPVATGTVTVSDGAQADIVFTPETLDYTYADLMLLYDETRAALTESGTAKTWTIVYTLTEDTPTDQAILKDIKTAEPQEITVTCSYPGTGNITCTSSPESSQVVFENTERANASIPVSVNKYLTNRPFTAGDVWNFTLTPVSGQTGAPLPAAAGGAASYTITNTVNTADSTSTVDFGSIIFTPAHLADITEQNPTGEKVYTYHITESQVNLDNPVENVITDGEKTFTVTVHLKDNGDLEAISNLHTQTPDTIFTNVYHDGCSIQLQALKALDPENWPSNVSSFIFKLEAAEGNTKNDSLAKIRAAANSETATELTTAASKTNKTGLFFPLLFNETDRSKTFKFVVSESSGEANVGVTYSPDKYDVTITFDQTSASMQPTVVVQKQGESTQTSYTNIVEPITVGTFTNNYRASGSLKLSVTKSMEGDIWPAGTAKYEFTLANGAGTNKLSVPETVAINRSDSSKTKEFTEILLDQTDGGQIYTFTVSEVIPPEAERKGVIYDTENTHTITVQIADDGNGSVAPTVVTVDGQPAGVTDNVFSAGTFTNRYDASGSLALAAQKSVENHDGNVNEERVFDFILKYANGDKAQVTTGTAHTTMDGTPASIEFVNSPLSYNLTKLEEFVSSGRTGEPTEEDGKRTWTIVYELYEDANSYKDLVPAAAPVTITVKVRDEGNGTLSCSTEPENRAITFVNRERANTSVTISGTKALIDHETGEPLSLRVGDVWLFALTATGPNKDKAPLPENTVVENTQGTYTFGTFPVTADHLEDGGADATYTYEITESMKPGESPADVALDPVLKRHFKIDVSTNADGNVTAVVSPTDPAYPSLTDELAYTNTQHDNAFMQLSATKAMAKDHWPAGTPNFCFRMTGKETADEAKLTAANPDPDAWTVDATELKKTVTFPTLTFTEAEVGTAGVTYTFYVAEIPLDDDDHRGIGYDNMPTHTVIVSVDKDLNISVTVNGTAVSPDESGSIWSAGTFTNTYSASGDLDLVGKKALSNPNGNTSLDHTFTFTVSYVKNGEKAGKAAEGHVTLKDGETKDIIFANDNKLSYTLDILDELVEDELAKKTEGKHEWKINYVLTEDDNDHDHLITNLQEFPFTVTVEDNGHGKLNCTSDLSTTTTVFSNMERKDYKLNLSGTKKLIGRDMKDTDIWNFTITAVDENADIAPLPTPATVSNDGETISFGEITFTPDHVGKTFTYVVSESGSVGSVDPDPYPKRFTVTVTLDENGNVLATPSSNLSNLLTFTNTYKAKGTAELKVNKALGNNSNWPEGKTVEFTLESKNDAPMPEGSSNGKKVITLGEPGEGRFGTITYPYTGPEMIGKEYTYEITETNGFGKGWTAAPSSITATVTIVKDNGDGTLETAVKYPPENNNTFTNSYETKGSLVLSAEKAFNRWDIVDSFTFKLETNYQDLVDQQIVSESSPKADFKQIDFSKFDDGQERKFTISEVIPNPPIAGVTYADPIVITVTPVDNGDGTMTLYSSGQALSKDENGIFKLNAGTLTNTYRSAGAGVIRVAKVLVGREWNNDDTYTFTLEPVNGAPKPGKDSVTITKDTAGQTAAFEEIPFSEPGTYEYTVKETNCNVRGVACDETVKTVTFKVERNEKGEIVAAADSDLIQDVSFTNTYNAVGKFTLRSAKNIVGADNDDTENHTIPFELWFKDDHDRSLKGDRTAKPFISRNVTITDNGTTPFDYPVKYTLEDLPDPADPESPQAGENGYLDDEKFFNLSLPALLRAIPAKAEKTTADNGDVTWTVNYVMDELTVVDQQLKPPDQTFDMLVTIEDKGDGELTVTELQYRNIYNDPSAPFKTVSISEGSFTFPDKEIFRNKERRDAAPVQISGIKNLEGREMTSDDKWTFTIEGIPAEGEASFTGPLPDPASVTNTNGSFTFEPVVFTAKNLGECDYTDNGSYYCQPKSYTYRVTESGMVAGVANDSYKEFTVTVSEDNEGDVQVDIDDRDSNTHIHALDENGNPVGQFLTEIQKELTFTNQYHESSEVSVQFSGMKTLSGRRLKDKEFSFTLLDGDGNVMQTVKNGADGSISFDPIFYSEPGVHHYTVLETAGDENGMTYDSRKYEITVTVTEVSGQLSVSTSGADIHGLNFSNAYRRFYRIKTMPETGFSALKPTVLGEQPKDLSYRPLAWTLEIPSLALMTDIVEVPSADGVYPVTWLGSSAGLLEGFGLPGDGHSVLTGHNHLNTMEAGPFALLQEMGIGDRIFVLDPQNGLQIFAVYANEKIAEKDIRGLEHIAERFDDSLTLITCEDERVEGGYANRRIIAAKPVNR